MSTCRFSTYHFTCRHGRGHARFGTAHRREEGVCSSLSQEPRRARFQHAGGAVGSRGGAPCRGNRAHKHRAAGTLSPACCGDMIRTVSTGGAGCEAPVHALQRAGSHLPVDCGGVGACFGAGAPGATMLLNRSCAAAGAMKRCRGAAVASARTRQVKTRTRAAGPRAGGQGGRQACRRAGGRGTSTLMRLPLPADCANNS